MKSISAIHHSYGTPSEVVNPEIIDVADAQKGQAIVKLLRASINPSDLGMIGGSYGRLRPLPATAGREGVGEVVSVGEGVDSSWVGKIVKLPPEPGAWTQYQACDASELIEIPAGLPLDMCAMAFINPPTALCILDTFEDLKEGDWFIQNGAGSALGYFAIQMCKARGIKTVNMLRNADTKRDELMAIGADIVVDEAEFDAKQIKAQTEGKLRLGLNQIGGASVSNMIKAMGDSATIVTIGGMVGDPVRFPTRFLIFNDLRLRGFWWDKWQRTHSAEEVNQVYQKIFKMIADGTLKAPVDSVFKIQDIKQALERAQTNSRSGKVMIDGGF
ncbi:MAG: 2-enoyl thioester reductase domain-containing protein [Opitutales bacterium]|nr:2-enoyl thioester reductase domain-containing protein [Opitutales bacterium]MBR7106631.1 2-enoyl thioester reductase domain-containing protein [Opitutales bacterium]